jgi:hypothetical protein
VTTLAGPELLTSPQVAELLVAGRTVRELAEKGASR